MLKILKNVSVLLALAASSCVQTETNDREKTDEVAAVRQALTDMRAIAGPSTPGMESPAGIIDPAIIGGTESSAGEWPWQANLGEVGDPLNLTNTVYPHFCGGSLISENWVVTAAHCVFGKKANTVIVRFGETKRSTAPDSNIQIRGVKAITIHPNYTNSQSWQVGDDIALLELNEAVTFTPRVRPIALAKTSPSTGVESWVSGWGRTDGSISTQSDALMDTNLTIQSNDTCNTYFASQYNLTGSINDKMLCAGDAGGDKGHCNGDSGGPLVYRANASSPWTQIGVVSWVITGCLSYSVYTRVSLERDWVYGVVPLAYKNGDLDRDGCVTSTDVNLVKSYLGSPPPADNVLIDTNNDGVVNLTDYQAVLKNIESACTPIP
jgi:secreted trypsin-like serine protease